MIQVPKVETFSLFGEPLQQLPIKLWLPSDEEEYKKKIDDLEKRYFETKKAYFANPDNPDNILWYGRQAGILGKFTEATLLYTEGIKKFPDDPRFRRFRGHRFALLRRLDLAIYDLELAVKLIRGNPDEPELYASGGPSKDKLGVSSFHWNVWYHLGFAHFAAGNLEKAEKAYLQCWEVTDTLEAKIATAHWLSMVKFRLGLLDDVNNLLGFVKEELELVEVGDYYECLLMHRGFKTREEVLRKARGESETEFLTRAHCVANSYLTDGNIVEAVKIFKEVLETGIWTAGVHLMAEAELKRLGEAP